MAGPWEKYAPQQQGQGPWTGYTPEQKGAFGRALSRVYENVVGSGEADTFGEKVGRAINQGGVGMLKGAAGLADAVIGGGRGMARDPAPISGYAEARLPAPETTLDKYAQTAGSFIPSTLAMGGVSPGALVKYAVLPGVASEAAGQVTEGKPIEPYARIAAGIGAPMAATGLANAGRRIVSPHGGVSPERLAMVERLRAEGVPVSAGQKTGAKGLQYLEAESPRMAQFFDDQTGAFSNAAMKRVGASGAATPENMKTAKAAIVKTMDDIIGTTDVPVSVGDFDRARKIVAEASALADTGALPPKFRHILSEIGKARQSGAPISGAQIKEWRSSLGAMVQGSGDAKQQAAHGLRELFDDMTAKTLNASGRADDFAKLQTARTQYRDYLAIERAMAGAGDNAALGQVSPAQLRTGVAGQGKDAYVTGSRDIGELARAGSTIMRPLPQSGTTPRAAARLKQAVGPLAAGGAAPGGLVGGATYLATKDPMLAIGAGGAAAMLPSAINAAKMSPIGQAYLGNQIARANSPVVNRHLMGPLLALMTGQGN